MLFRAHCVIMNKLQSELIDHLTGWSTGNRTILETCVPFTRSCSTIVGSLSKSNWVSLLFFDGVGYGIKVA